MGQLLQRVREAAGTMEAGLSLPDPRSPTPGAVDTVKRRCRETGKESSRALREGSGA